MSTRNLDYLFDPHSVAIIGASRRPYSVGATVLRNMLASPFRGPVFAVNPKYRTLSGRPAYPDVAALPEVPSLTVICTPAATVPSIVVQLGPRHQGSNYPVGRPGRRRRRRGRPHAQAGGPGRGQAPSAAHPRA